MMDVLIRKVRLEDAAAVVRILNAILEAGGYTVFDSPFTVEAEERYIARYNPLEDNVSAYYLKDGRRVMLAYSGKIELADGWHLLKISHRGDRIRAYLDGDMKLMVNAGNYIAEKGGVGLWTKADAATAFDNFTVVPR